MGFYREKVQSELCCSPNMRAVMYFQFSCNNQCKNHWWKKSSRNRAVSVGSETFSRFSWIIYCIHSSVSESERERLALSSRCYHRVPILLLFWESLLPGYHHGGAFDLLNDSQEQECTPWCQLTQSSVAKICYLPSHKAVSPDRTNRVM